MIKQELSPVRFSCRMPTEPMRERDCRGFCGGGWSEVHGSFSL